MSFSSSLNPDVVKTELDDVFMQEFNIENHQNYADATTESLFRQSTSDKAAEQEEVFKGVKAWDIKDEEEDVQEENPLITNKQTFTNITYAKGVSVPKEFFDDNMHGSYEKMVRDFARKARVTRDKNAFGQYRGGFDTTLTADGAAWFSNSHTTIIGDTVDNLETAALSPDTLDSMITSLGEQKDQAGEILGGMPAALVVPMALFKKAVEITDSELLADTTDNNVNWVSSKYGIRIYTTPFLGAAAGGSDTACFLLGDNHASRRWVREGVSTTLVPWQQAKNDAYFYKGRFRETTGVIDYVGAVATDGTT